eukprot:CAMPEP_0206367746 /NCGR_PEP_ID=MMETSP0294-20121207/4246_1 /ASSEMBLY_ACC=CAM_ASM_000327 /TAXON_ID=39354 /ORGANISM="Heterosigma akashiwo, Strain CCMP2393" /LENGTH=128 /DNA_ID=CAMNT_0053814091 /DNA_START=194 /DNA_END=581 /DNA_ORIENTATION=+
MEPGEWVKKNTKDFKGAPRPLPCPATTAPLPVGCPAPTPPAWPAAGSSFSATTVSGLERFAPLQQGDRTLTAEACCCVKTETLVTISAVLPSASPSNTMIWCRSYLPPFWGGAQPDLAQCSINGSVCL